MLQNRCHERQRQSKKKFPMSFPVTLTFVDPEERIVSLADITMSLIPFEKCPVDRDLSNLSVLIARKRWCLISDIYYSE